MNNSVEAADNGTDDSAALLCAIVNSSDDAIVSKTLDGVITSWNPAAERMFGWAAAEAIGRHITLIIPPERLAEEDMILDKLRHGENIDHFETIRQAKNGRRLNISLTVSPVRDGDGRIIGASKIARDITAKKRLERELLEQVQLLKKEVVAREKARAAISEAVAARDEFIAVAAHELRNPLNVFVLTLQLLHRLSRDSLGGSQIQEIIEKSRTQLNRLRTLIDRLLDVTSIRNGTFELHRERFDLAALVREVVSRFNTEPCTLPISLNLEPAIAGAWDRLRIDQALTNLLSNAVKYGGGKPVGVKAELKDDHAAITVEDHGIGMAAAEMDKIFDRSGPVSRKSHAQGLGLGLWITKRIVEAHGGTIKVRSKLGDGSAFTLMLPRIAAE
jgi:PAS domain S-box-containing protein